MGVTLSSKLFCISAVCDGGFVDERVIFRHVAAI